MSRSEMMCFEKFVDYSSKNIDYCLQIVMALMEDFFHITGSQPRILFIEIDLDIEHRPSVCSFPTLKFLVGVSVPPLAVSFGEVSFCGVAGAPAFPSSWFAVQENDFRRGSGVLLGLYGSVECCHPCMVAQHPLTVVLP